jgi:acyl-CoA thioesterase
MSEREGLVELLGMTEEPVRPGEVRFALRTEPRHRNIGGVVHGSVTMALLDSAMGHATSSLLAPDEFCATTEISFQFLAAAWPGDRLVATGVVTKRARTVAFLEGVCRNDAGDVVARAHGTWHIGRRRP